jgi:hypothetical protein
MSECLFVSNDSELADLVAAGYIFNAGPFDSLDDCNAACNGSGSSGSGSSNACMCDNPPTILCVSISASDGDNCACMNGVTFDVYSIAGGANGEGEGYAWESAAPISACGQTWHSFVVCAGGPDSTQLGFALELNPSNEGTDSTITITSCDPFQASGTITNALCNPGGGDGGDLGTITVTIVEGPC